MHQGVLLDLTRLDQVGEVLQSIAPVGGERVAGAVGEVHAVNVEAGTVVAHGGAAGTLVTAGAVSHTGHVALREGRESLLCRVAAKHVVSLSCTTA